MTARIRSIHAWSRGTYGVPRIEVELAEEYGIRIGCKRVARLMREARIEGICRRKKLCTTRRDPEAGPAPDLVEREFAAPGLDRLGVADITYVPTWAGFLHLAVVLDVFSRRVVGWAMRADLKTGLALEALEMTIWQRRPKGVIHHSDQGTQYTLVAFGARCREAGIVAVCRWKWARWVTATTMPSPRASSRGSSRAPSSG